MRFRTIGCKMLALAALSGLFAGMCPGLCPDLRAEERITLRNGFSLTCDHREAVDVEHVRLYLSAGSGSYMDVEQANIASAETVPAEPSFSASAARAVIQAQSTGTAASVDSLIQSAGEMRRLNVDLLRSVVNAESGGRVHAVSRAGAQGLMQLMPATARSLGVLDSFAPDQNVRGGTDYLDSLLRRYHDDLQLALAAYNAGPAAVDRYHGVPPYRETRLYVARIIREFNRRTLLTQHGGAAVMGAVAAR